MPVAAVKRQSQLVAELDAARKRSEDLFSVLKPSYLYERPIAERHRVVFYIGHLEAFDYIQICHEGLGRNSSEPELDALFQAGIDPDSSHLPTDSPADWPTLDMVYQYVSRTRRAIDEALDSAPEEAIQMALEHRLMHLETLAYMWHNFDHSTKRRLKGEIPLEAQPPRDVINEWQPVPAGIAVIGKRRDELFGWDNEYDEHEVATPEFAIQKFKVTNGEYLKFVRAGASRPHFWVERRGKLYLRGMFEEIPLPLDWPVYVTQQEASAYAAWIGKALPTEAQFHRAAFGSQAGEARRYPWGDAQPSPSLGNFDFKRWDPESVHATPANESAWGVRQLTGNGWEWTQTVFGPFAGFNPSVTYPGYSANFFDDAHYVMKGSSPRTAARLLRRSFRNWFRADYPYVYGAFRCVEN